MASPQEQQKPSTLLFWGCFVALIATSFGFITRMLLLGRFQQDFNIDKVTLGQLQGAGIWPFAISIILFSLIIDRIGYRIAMIFSFVCYVAYLIMASMAYSSIQGLTGDALHAAQKSGYDLLYWGSIILALGNGTVEAYVNPVVATMYRHQKVVWLNRLHAGWPGGLVFGGLITIGMADTAATGDWRLVLGLIALPAVIFFFLLIGAKFPVSEREQAGVSYREMLSEFGAVGALIGFGLIFAQLGQLPMFGWSTTTVWTLTLAVAVGFGLYTRSLGRGILAVLVLIMMPLAITELGTDGWISSLMEQPLHAAGAHPGWVLVYTSFIMMLLRYFGGSIAHKISPITLLCSCTVLAIVSLFLLSKCGDAGVIAIFGAATLYGVAKTFFWPTMLGVTAEQCPKGGALTLNAIGGIGMIAVGVIGFPLIGAMQERTATAHLKDNAPVVAQAVLAEKSYLLGQYQAIDPELAKSLPQAEAATALAAANKAGQFDALAKITIFPTMMLVGYIGLGLYFRSRGGYKPTVLNTGAH